MYNPWNMRYKKSSDDYNDFVLKYTCTRKKRLDSTNQMSVEIRTNQKLIRVNIKSLATTITVQINWKSCERSNRMIVTLIKFFTRPHSSPDSNQRFFFQFHTSTQQNLDYLILRGTAQDYRKCRNFSSVWRRAGTSGRLLVWDFSNARRVVKSVGNVIHVILFRGISLSRAYRAS